MLLGNRFVPTLSDFYPYCINICNETAGYVIRKFGDMG